MPCTKRTFSHLDEVELPSGKRQQATTNKTTKLVPTAQLMFELPVYRKPSPNLVSVFTNIGPFRDALRESAGLDKFEYTRLRQTCQTIAQGWRAYPENSTEPDTHDPYFAGLAPSECNSRHCSKTSKDDVVRPCYGKCGKNVCFHCVWFAQKSFDQHRTSETELHWCRGCNRNVYHEYPGGVPECNCGFDGKHTVEDQGDSDWQCMDCRESCFHQQNMAARQNLLEREADGRVFTINPHLYTVSMDNLRRWIDVQSRNRNRCPGCSGDYQHIQDTYYDWVSRDYMPSRLWLRQCMVCLQKRP
jgi:hypothetical protein